MFFKLLCHKMHGYLWDVNFFIASFSFHQSSDQSMVFLVGSKLNLIDPLFSFFHSFQFLLIWSYYFSIGSSWIFFMFSLGKLFIMLWEPSLLKYILAQLLVSIGKKISSLCPSLKWQIKYYHLVSPSNILIKKQLIRLAS